MRTDWVTAKRRLFLIASFAAYASVISNSSAQGRKLDSDHIPEVKSQPRIYGNSEKGDSALPSPRPAAVRKTVNPPPTPKTAPVSGKQLKEKAQEQRAQLRSELMGGEMEDARRREFLASADDAKRQAREQARKILDEIKETAVNSRKRE
jgi:hypothetical protein